MKTLNQLKNEVENYGIKAKDKTIKEILTFVKGSIIKKFKDNEWYYNSIKDELKILKFLKPYYSIDSCLEDFLKIVDELDNAMLRAKNISSSIYKLVAEKLCDSDVDGDLDLVEFLIRKLYSDHVIEGKKPEIEPLFIDDLKLLIKSLKKLNQKIWNNNGTINVIIELLEIKLKEVIGDENIQDTIKF